MRKRKAWGNEREAEAGRNWYKTTTKEKETKQAGENQV